VCGMTRVTNSTLEQLDKHLINCRFCTAKKLITSASAIKILSA
jgi:hypothetical protein